MFDFTDQVVIVTGAGTGLGRCYAIEFARRGAKVVVNDLGGDIAGEGASGSAANSVVAEIEALGGQAVPSYDSVEKGDAIVLTALEHFGRVDVLVNNAGIICDRSFAKMTDDDWGRVYRVHLYGSYKCTKAAWSVMQQQQYGRVINTTSASGIYGNFGQANYAAAKLGLVGLTNTLAIEGAPYNIKVNAVAPVAGSRMLGTVVPPEVKAALKMEWVSALVVRLCARENEDTGSLFEVGGGWLAKLCWARSSGVWFDTEEPVSAEDVDKVWKTICNLDQPDYPGSLEDTLGPLYQRLGVAVDGAVLKPQRQNSLDD